jgi:hypothetical protein
LTVGFLRPTDDVTQASREAALFAVGHYTLELLARNCDRLYARFLGNDLRTKEMVIVDRANDIATYRSHQPTAEGRQPARRPS